MAANSASRFMRRKVDRVMRTLYSREDKERSESGSGMNKTSMVAGWWVKKARRNHLIFFSIRQVSRTRDRDCL